ncbi:hypothetical protein ACH5RR_032848 [Cinchona calisaya]|uniref:Uncharacterized protein n=1 Tax=Cinchona calisaya TaxID=153742 RepID=A0ABD2YKL5_9GENT
MMAEEQLAWGMMKEGCRKGPWTAEEDRLLIEYVKLHGEGRWNSVARLAGLKRNGKSCRLRWVNYLRPDLKKGQITPHEEKIIQELHARWGNRWSTIARSLPGRTDNEIKNYWRTHFKKKATGSFDYLKKSKSHLLRRQQFLQQQQTQPQTKQDYAAAAAAAAATILFPNAIDDHNQVFLYSMFDNYATVPEGTNHEDVIWDGLWNLDVFNGNINYAISTNKASLQTSTACPFS